MYKQESRIAYMLQNSVLYEDYHNTVHCPFAEYKQISQQNP
jgi:hypothetical protein